MREGADGLKKVRNVLMEDWDPLNVCSIPERAAEYDSFADSIKELLYRRRSEPVLVAYLRWAAERMGVATSSAELQPVVVKLLQLNLGQDRSQRVRPRIRVPRTTRCRLAA